ncbi:MAG: hypothetical protein AAB360_00935 [Patescibacteria group bacterium]
MLEEIKQMQGEGIIDYMQLPIRDEKLSAEVQKAIVEQVNTVLHKIKQNLAERVNHINTSGKAEQVDLEQQILETISPNLQREDFINDRANPNLNLVYKNVRALLLSKLGALEKVKEATDRLRSAENKDHSGNFVKSHENIILEGNPLSDEATGVQIGITLDDPAGARVYESLFIEPGQTQR